MSDKIQQLINAIRTAAAEDASPQDKERGAEACKTLGALFGATPGEPLAPPMPAPTPLAQAVDQVRGASPTVLLGALINQLRSRLPAEQPAEEPEPRRVDLQIPFVPLPTRSGKD